MSISGIGIVGGTISFDPTCASGVFDTGICIGRAQYVCAGGAWLKDGVQGLLLLMFASALYVGIGIGGGSCLTPILDEGAGLGGGTLPSFAASSCENREPVVRLTAGQGYG